MEEIKDEEVVETVEEAVIEEELTEEIVSDEQQDFDNQRNYKRQREGRRGFNKEGNKDFRNRSDKDDFKFRRMRKKVCLLCKEKNYVLDYKDEETLRRFINEKGKILPRRATGTCAKHQREIAKEVKRARHIGILPYTTD